MGSISYSEKEIAIFNGVIALMEQGANPYSIKVSDIAKAADIGKGTIYDYFASKEEAISQAILYSITGEIETAYSRIKHRDSFKEKFYEILYIIGESIENKVSTFNMLLSVGGIQEFYEYLSDDKYDLSKYIYRIKDLFNYLLKIGVDEEAISMTGDSYYRNMVLGSTIMGFSQYVSQRKLYHDTSMEDAMEASYKLIIKALN